MHTSHTSGQSLGRSFSAFALAAVAGVAIGAAPQAAHAQCGPQWLAPLPPVGVEGSTYAVCTWDPDGAGPLNPWLVVGGFIEAAGGMEANNVAAWDGVQWHSLNSVYGPTDPDPDAVVGDVSGLASFDPDDDGPEPAWLIAAGSVDRTTADVGVAPWSFHRWMGDHWVQLNGNWPIRHGSIVQFDPDDDGPMPRHLVLAGWGDIEMFDGHNWAQIPVLGAPGLNPDIRSLMGVTAWDADGSGAMPRQIVGVFVRSTRPDSYQLARWDGATWIDIPLPVDPGFSASISLGAWDPDGRGPQSEQLYVAVDKAFVAGSIDWYDGTQWHSILRPDFGGRIGDVLFQPFDADGDGPAPEQLVMLGVSSEFGDGAVVWNGTSLEPLPMDGERYHPEATAVCTWDGDGEGPRSARLVAADNEATLSAPSAPQRNGVSIYDGHLWDAIGRGPSASVADIVRWSREGGDVLLAAGAFHTANGVRLDGIGLFDGASWEPMPPLDWPVGEMILWDADGEETTPPTLVATQNVEYRTVQVSALIGEQWQNLGNEMRSGAIIAAGITTTRESLYYIERDEVGPGIAIREWDGNQWVQQSAFVDGQDGYLPILATRWLPPDSSQPLLVFGGNFTGFDTADFGSVIAWDGQQFLSIGNRLWSTLGDGFARVIAVDFDGNGPQSERLVAIGRFDRAGASDEPFEGIAILEGNVWRPVLVPPEWSEDRQMMTQCVWDPDGDGPIMPTLRMFGFQWPVPWHRATAWEYDGQVVRRLEQGATGVPSSSVQWDPDGPGPIPPRIQVAGSAYSMDYPERGSVFEAFLDDATPWVATSPRDVGGFEGDTITLTASIANGYAELDGGVQFQWRRDGIAIQDGPAGASSNGGTVAGASGTLHLSIPSTLTITNAATTDSGDYDLVVTNSCGTLNSASARVQVAPFCAGDFDASGTIDATDLAAFFTAYETGATTADVDRSGGVDASDLGAFFAAYEGGC